MISDFKIIWSNNKKLVPIHKQPDLRKLGLSGYSNNYNDFCYRLDGGKFMFGVNDIKDKKGNIITCRKNASIWSFGSNYYWIEDDIIIMLNDSTKL